MLFSAQGVPPQGYYQSIWDFTSHNENSTKEAGNVVPFDFGRAAEFRAPKSIETSIAPALTPYCLEPFGGYVATISRGKVWGESGALLTPEGN